MIVIFTWGYFPAKTAILSLVILTRCLTAGMQTAWHWTWHSHLLNGGLYGSTQLYNLFLCVYAHMSYSLSDINIIMIAFQRESTRSEIWLQFCHLTAVQCGALSYSLSLGHLSDKTNFPEALGGCNETMHVLGMEKSQNDISWFRIFTVMLFLNTASCLTWEIVFMWGILTDGRWPFPQYFIVPLEDWHVCL